MRETDHPTRLHRPVIGSALLFMVALLAVTLSPRVASLSAQSEPTRWLNILCRFSGNTTEPRDIAYFNDRFSTHYPGIRHYWRTVSYNTLDIQFDTAGWYTLPRTMTHYVNRPLNTALAELFDDCVTQLPPEIDPLGYAGFNLIFNGVFDGQAHGRQHTATVNSITRTVPVTWLPHDQYRRPAYVAQVMGLALGMERSNNSDNDDDNTDNPWDVMSNVFFPACAHTPESDCIPQHPIAYHKERMGWIAPTARQSYSGQVTLTVDIDYLDAPTQGGLHLLTVPGLNGTYYTVEARRKLAQSYDDALPGTAIILHHVNPSRAEPAWLVGGATDSDSRGEAAQWKPGERFTDTQADIYIDINSQSANGFSVTVGRLTQTLPTGTPTEIPTATPTPTLIPSATPTLPPGVTPTDTPPPTATPPPPTATPPIIELLRNGGFESYTENNQPTYWEGRQLRRDRIRCGAGIAYSGQCAYVFRGVVGKQSRLVQNISAQNFSAGSTLTLSAHFRTNKAPIPAILRANIRYAEPGIRNGVLKISSPKGTKAYQQREQTLVLAGRPTSIRVQIIYRGESGRVFVDDVSLTISP